MTKRSRKLPEGAIDMGKECSRLLKEQEERSRKAAGEKIKPVTTGRACLTMGKASAALENYQAKLDKSSSKAAVKPLLDRMRDFEDHCRKCSIEYPLEQDAWDIRRGNTWAWGVETAAAVRKHKARKFQLNMLKPICEKCGLNKGLLDWGSSPRICRDCAIEQDFGKVE